MSQPTRETTSIGRYLVDRVGELGVEHVFGIPGDYVLGLYKLLEESPIQLVGTTREDNAGYAADAYARVRLRRGLQVRREVLGPGTRGHGACLGDSGRETAARLGWVLPWRGDSRGSDR